MFGILQKVLSLNRPLTSLTLYSANHEFTDLSTVYQALQQKKNLERLFIRASHRCAMWPVTDHNPESGLSDLQEALKSNVSLQNMSLTGVGDNEVKYIADGLINHPSLEIVVLVNGIYSVVKIQIAHVPRLFRALYSCPALHKILVSSGLTACCSWAQDDVTNGHWDVRHDTGSESETGDLIGTSLLQERLLVLDFFSHVRQSPFIEDPHFLPNTGKIVEGLCEKLMAHYPFLKNCGFAMLQFHNPRVFALFKFEPMRADETGPLDSTLIPTEWKSVDDIGSFETIRAFQEKRQLEEGEDSGELKKQTAWIGVRIRMDNKRMDLLLKVVEGVCWIKRSDHLRSLSGPKALNCLSQPCCKPVISQSHALSLLVK